MRHEVRLRTIPTRVGRTSTSSADTAHGYGPSPRAWGEHQQRRVSDLAATGPSPRAWGEQPDRGHAWTCGCGPSPRAWGERSPACRTCAELTDHPHARGENGSGEVCADSARTDHPHARGENAPRQRRSCWSNGPSPRAWGEPWIFQHLSWWIQGKCRLFRLRSSAFPPPISPRPSTGR